MNESRETGWWNYEIRGGWGRTQADVWHPIEQHQFMIDADGIVTVRMRDGRTKSAHLGNSPPVVIARLLLRELEGEDLT